jgi:hypothetical protein
MLYLSHRPLDTEIPFDPTGYRVEVTIDDRSEAGLVASELKLHWRTAGAQAWQEVLLTEAGGPDVYEAWIPAHPSRVKIEYYVAAADESARAETLPRTAPAAHYSFTVADAGFTIDVAAAPQLVAPGATTPFAVTIDSANEAIVDGSAVLYAATDGATFRAYPLTHLGGDGYEALLPRGRCGEEILYYLQAEGTQTGVKRLPPLHEFTAQVGSLDETTLLAADFEQGVPGGWQTTGLWHATSSCAAGDSCDGVTWAYFGVDGACSYATGSRATGELNAPVVQLPDVSLTGRLTLSYCSRLITENKEGYDVAGVYVDDIRVDVPVESADWQTREVDLTAFAGQAVQLSWRFDSIDGYFNDQLGWQVDAIELRADELACIDTCAGDLDGDGDVDQADLGVLLAAYERTHAGDTDADGDTDQADLGQLLSEYGQGCF